MDMTTSKVGRKYTVVIPQKIREKIPIQEGETIVWSVEGEKIVVKPLSFLRLAGIVESSTLTKSKKVHETLEKELKKDVEEAFK